MKTTKLISGQFTSAEAKEVLLDMIDSKINFHKIKSLSSQVRCNQPNRESERRIKELSEAREELLALIQEAKLNNMNLQIESTIHVTFKAKEQAKEVCLEVENS